MKLYKYCTFDRLDVMRNGVIRFTQPHLFNDPFELATTMGSVFGSVQRDGLSDQQKPRTELAQILSLMADTLLTVAAKGVRSHFAERIGVLSLTEKPDNLLMWAHYGAEHRGFVIEFESTHAFFDRKESNNARYGRLCKVEYAEERPSVAMTDYNAFDGLLRKSREWEYEQEWRMFLPLESSDRQIEVGGNTVHLFAVPAECVRSVILGARSTPEDRWAMAELLVTEPRYQHVTLFEATLDEKCFGLRVEPSPVRHLASGARALEARDYDAAVRELDRAVELRPENPAYIKGRAYANVSAARWDAVESDLQRLEALRYQDEWTWLVRSILARRNDDWAGALAAIDHVLELSKEPDPQLWIERASLLMRLGRDEEASETLDRYDAARPGDPEGFRKRAELSHRGGDVEGALREIRKAIAAAEETPIYRWIESAYLMELGRDAEALESLDAAIGKQPDDPDYLERRATVHERLEDPEAAFEDLERAIALVPDNLDLRMRRARLQHVGRNRPDLALRDLDWAIEHHPEQARLYWIRAHLRRQLGQESDAEADLEELRRRDPALYRELVDGEA